MDEFVFPCVNYHRRVVCYRSVCDGCQSGWLILLLSREKEFDLKLHRSRHMVCYFCFILYFRLICSPVPCDDTIHDIGCRIVFMKASFSIVIFVLIYYCYTVLAVMHKWNVQSYISGMCIVIYTAKGVIWLMFCSWVAVQICNLLIHFTFNIFALEHYCGTKLRCFETCLL